MTDHLQAQPRLITLEGGEGAGKSTALAAVRTLLEATGDEVVVTREPGGTPLAEQLRNLVLHAKSPDQGGEPLSAEAELLMVFAARAQHVRQVIVPALSRGAWVLSDRFTDSSFAYQGGGRQLDEAWIDDLEKRVVGFLPGLTVWLDVPVAIGRARALGRGGEPDNIEREQDAFFERVRSGFALRAQQQPDRFARIDASLPQEAVMDQVRTAIAAHIQKVQA